MPPEKMSLRLHEVHVWIADLDQPASTVGSCWDVLSADERGRANRFRFERDRTSYTVARTALRCLLGGYLRVRPSRIAFQYTVYGKPFLKRASNPTGITFNISHAHKLALLAFAVRRRVGVDVELVRPDFGTLEIARQFFSQTEVASLRAQPPGLRAECFFNCWTRKEAYIKAVGEGLSYPLDRFDVTLGPGESARLLATRVESQDASSWCMRELDPGPGYKAAIIAEGRWQLKCWRWVAAYSSLG